MRSISLPTASNGDCIHREAGGIRLLSERREIMKPIAKKIIVLLVLSCVHGTIVSAEQSAFPLKAVGSGQSKAVTWTKVDEGKTGVRYGSALLWAPDLKRMLLVGPAEGAPCVQAFDAASPSWRELTSAAPAARNAFYPYYQAAYDPGGQTVYCLSGGPILYSFSIVTKTWKAHTAATALDGLSWQTMACDPVGRKLVVVGADKKTDNLGWSRTVVYEIPSGKWSRLEVADERVVKEHRELVAAKEACIDLVGHIRLAWYRDPKGSGPGQRKARRFSALRGFPANAADARVFSGGPGTDRPGATAENARCAELPRGLQRQIEEAAETQYPVPCARRNSPLAFDEKNRVFVLFGGDHEDYLLNDTWILDLAKKTWRRARPDRAPTPRAGHAACVACRRAAGSHFMRATCRVPVRITARGPPGRSTRVNSGVSIPPRTAGTWRQVGRCQQGKIARRLRLWGSSTAMPASGSARRPLPRTVTTCSCWRPTAALRPGSGSGPAKLGRWRWPPANATRPAARARAAGTPGCGPQSATVPHGSVPGGLLRGGRGAEGHGS